jgi:hypothetical protein
LSDLHGNYNHSLAGSSSFFRSARADPAAPAVLGVLNILMAIRFGEGCFARIDSPIVAPALIGFLWRHGWRASSGGVSFIMQNRTGCHERPVIAGRQGPTMTGSSIRLG